jgi:hypothetical protein
MKMITTVGAERAIALRKKKASSRKQTSKESDAYRSDFFGYSAPLLHYLNKLAAPGFRASVAEATASVERLQEQIRRQGTGFGDPRPSLLVAPIRVGDLKRRAAERDPRLARHAEDPEGPPEAKRSRLSDDVGGGETDGEEEGVLPGSSQQLE